MAMEDDKDRELVREAYEAKKNAYAPYSGFHVGAALRTEEGTVYRGCNIENAAYTPTNCAERTAFFKAVSEGEKNFSCIAIAGESKDYLFPCGVCRQVMAEFCDPEHFKVIVAKSETEYKIYSLGELFPGSFSKKDLKKIDKEIS